MLRPPQVRGRPEFLVGWPAQGMGCEIWAAMMKPQFDGHVVVGGFGFRGVPAGPGPVTGHVLGGVPCRGVPDGDDAEADQPERHRPLHGMAYPIAGRCRVSGGRSTPRTGCPCAAASGCSPPGHDPALHRSSTTADDVLGRAHRDCRGGHPSRRRARRRTSAPIHEQHDGPSGHPVWPVSAAPSPTVGGRGQRSSQDAAERRPAEHQGPESERQQNADQPDRDRLRSC